MDNSSKLYTRVRYTLGKQHKRGKFKEKVVGLRRNLIGDRQMHSVHVFSDLEWNMVKENNILLNNYCRHQRKVFSTVSYNIKSIGKHIINEYRNHDSQKSFHVVKSH